MNINAKNLDLSFTQCEELNNLAKNSGTNLIDSLKIDIDNLKMHWKGSDATIHVNNLIKVYNALISIVTDAKQITFKAGSAISEIQQVRKNNGGSGNVGSALDSTEPDASTIQPIETTSEYLCEPSTKNDYNRLEQIYTEYNQFINQFIDKKNDLMSNWTSGANREGAVKVFDEFSDNTNSYKEYLENAKKNLGIAVRNLDQL